MAENTTVIMYDFDRIKGGEFEFVNITTKIGKQKLDNRLKDMINTIAACKAVFGGQFLMLKTVIIDQQGNQLEIENEPLILEVPYYLTELDIKYIKEIDDGLVAVM